jgi:hypothetical protein
MNEVKANAVLNIIDAAQREGLSEFDKLSPDERDFIRYLAYKFIGDLALENPERAMRELLFVEENVRRDHQALLRHGRPYGASLPQWVNEWMEKMMRVEQGMPDECPMIINGTTGEWNAVIDYLYRRAFKQGRDKVSMQEIMSATDRAMSTVKRNHSNYISQFGYGPMHDDTA